jgi:hypothetical protein
MVEDEIVESVALGIDVETVKELRVARQSLCQLIGERTLSDTSFPCHEDALAVEEGINRVEEWLGPSRELGRILDWLMRSKWIWFEIASLGGQVEDSDIPGLPSSICVDGVEVDNLVRGECSESGHLDERLVDKVLSPFRPIDKAVAVER